MEESEFRDRYASMLRSVEVKPDAKKRVLIFALENCKPHNSRFSKLENKSPVPNPRNPL